MNYNPDSYYNRTEVSNSDLTELKNLLHPRQQFGDKEAAFRFGNLVDAIITEPERVDYYHLKLVTTLSLRKCSNSPTHSDSWSTRRNNSNIAISNSLSILAANGTGGCKWLTSEATSKQLSLKRNSSSTRLSTSSTGIVLVRGIWTSRIAIKISSMASARRIAVSLRSSSNVATISTIEDVKSMKNWRSTIGASVYNNFYHYE